MKTCGYSEFEVTLKEGKQSLSTNMKNIHEMIEMYISLLAVTAVFVGACSMIFFGWYFLYMLKLQGMNESMSL